MSKRVSKFATPGEPTTSRGLEAVVEAKNVADSEQFQSSKNYCLQNLHMTSPQLTQLRQLWGQKYRDMSFVNCASLAEFNANTPDEFKAAIGNSIDDTREVLLNEWIPDCADIIRSGLHEEKEQLKTPKKKKGIEPRLEHTKFFPHGKAQMKSYFKTVATMMELQV